MTNENLEELKRLTGESHIEGLLKHHYNIEVQGIDFSDANIKIRSEMGSFLIKQISSEKIETYKLVAQLYQHIGENKEFFPIVSPRITTSSLPYFHGYRHSYVLLPWIEGKEFSLKTSEDWSLLAQSLAQFHRSTREFLPRTSFPSNIKPEPWGNLWKEQLKQLEVFVLSPKLTASPTKFDLVWLDKAKYINSILDDAISYYERIKGNKIYENSLNYSRVCYNNIRQHNILVTPENKLRLLGWGNISVESRVRDIKDLLIYAYGRTSNKKVLAAILHGYNKVSSIHPSEYDLVYASTLFPERMMALLDAVYTRQEITPTDASDRISRVLDFETKKLSLLRDYADILKDDLDISVSVVDWIHR